MRHLPTAAALTLLLTLMLVGCSSNSGFSVESDGGTTAIVNAAGDRGMDAQVVGTVVLTARSCWALKSDDGTVHAVAWPPGTEVSDSTLTVPGLVEPGDDKLLEPGTQLIGAGGDLAMDALAPFTHECWEGQSHVIVMSGPAQ